MCPKSPIMNEFLLYEPLVCERISLKNIGNYFYN